MAKSKKKKIIIGVLGVVVLAVLVVYVVKSNRVERKSVKVEEAKKGDITAIVTATGHVEAKKEVKVSADVMGRIIKLPVVEGQKVKAGDLLVQIDPATYEADVARAEASLTSAKALLNKAQLAYNRNKGLYEKKLISKEEFDLSYSDLLSAQGQVAQAEASLRQAKDQLSKTTIRSPIDGIITVLNSEEGENVVIGTMNNPGTIIMTVSDLSQIEIKADVDETDIASIKLGERVNIKLDAFPDTTIEGVVTEIGNSAKGMGLGSQDQVVNFLVTIQILKPIDGIRPGMTATVDIITAEHKGVVYIPIQAVVMRIPPEDSTSEGDAKSNIDKTSAEKNLKTKGKKEAVEGVFVVRDGVAKFVSVKTGIADQQNIEIKKGVSVGDSIIIGSFKILRSLNDGDFVKPIKKPKNKK